MHLQVCSLNLAALAVPARNPCLPATRQLVLVSFPALPLPHVCTMILRNVCEFHRILSGNIAPSAFRAVWLRHSAFPGCIATGTSISAPTHLQCYLSPNVESSWNGLWLSLFGDPWRPLFLRNTRFCPFEWFAVHGSCLASMRQIPQNSNNGLRKLWTTPLGCWQPVDAFKNAPRVVPTNNMLVLSTKPDRFQCMIDSCFSKW